MAYKFEGQIDTPNQIPDEVYQETLEHHFGEGGPADDTLAGGALEGSRRDDIEDTFARTRPYIEGVMPDDTDQEVIDRVASQMAFLERFGFESGVKWSADQSNRYDPDSPEEVLRRSHELGT